jgi:hypothetical protein
MTPTDYTAKYSTALSRVNTDIKYVVGVASQLSRIPQEQERCHTLLDYLLFYNPQEEKSFLEINPEWTRQRTQTRSFTRHVESETGFLKYKGREVLIRELEVLDKLKIPRISIEYRRVRSIEMPYQNQGTLESVMRLSNLQSINCPGNKLTTLPLLPTTLKRIDIYHNPNLDSNHLELVKARANGCQVYT